MRILLLAAFTEGMIAQTKIAGNLGICNTVTRRKIIDLIMKPGFKSSLKGIDMKKGIRLTKYDQKNTGEKVLVCSAGNDGGYGN
jgi:3-dehydroquinate synthetase